MRGASVVLCVGVMLLASAVPLWAADPQPPETDIWTAAAQGDIEAIKQHLDAGTDINGTFVVPGIPGSGGTPLHVAVLAGQMEVAKVLLDEGANINARADDEHGGTPLHWAGAIGRVDFARVLVEAGADVNAKDNNGYTPLDATAYQPEQEKEAKLEIARILAENGRKRRSELLTEMPQPSAIDIWTAARNGDVEAVQGYVSSGADLNAKEPTGGSTPLIVAAVFGQTEAARLLVENGADLEARNNDGSTALIVAAFFCHPETVKLLIAKGADVNARNNSGQTPLDAVAAEWGPALEGLYMFLADVLETELDLEEIYSLRSVIADILRKHGGSKGRNGRPRRSARKPVGDVTDVAARGLRCSYYMDGRIYVNVLGTPEGKPVTVPPVKGQEDFKPSWSKTGDMLVFFRRVKNDPVVTNWKTVLCVINVDGTGFQELTDATYTNFNPTWTRDGTNRPIWNRRNPETGGFFVMCSKVGNKPGQEVAVSDKRYHTWAHTCLKDGRILVESLHPTKGWGYYLMTPKAGGASRFERIDCGGLAKKGLLCRISLSPSEKRICFGHLMGHKFREPGHAITIADFDVKKRTIANANVIANKDRKPIWFAYPRWTKGEAAVVYHSYQTGRGGLYLYTLKDGSTVRVSTDPRGDYRYPHGEGLPK